MHSWFINIEKFNYFLQNFDIDSFLKVEFLSIFIGLMFKYKEETKTMLLKIQKKCAEFFDFLQILDAGLLYFKGHT